MSITMFQIAALAILIPLTVHLIAIRNFRKRVINTSLSRELDKYFEDVRFKRERLLQSLRGQS